MMQLFGGRAGKLDPLARGAACAALAAAVLLASGCSKKAAEEAEQPPTVQVTAVTQAAIHNVVSGDGVLYPYDQSSVMPKITAPVEAFHVNRGDHVKKGQLLAELENRDLTAQVAEAQGAVEQARSNLRATSDAAIPESVVRAQTDVDADKQAVDAAKRVLDARQQLLTDGALARRQVDEAQVNWAQANSAYLAAQEHLRVLQAVAKEEQVKTATAQVNSAVAHQQDLSAQLSYSKIYSPMDGVIAERPLWPGEMASPTTTLFTVMDISRVVARVNIAQALAEPVKVGQPATITLTDTGEKVEGKVTVVSPATDASSTTVQVWVQADNPGEKLKPGASVHVGVVTNAAQNAMVVPAAAILPGDEGGTAVLVITSDSIAHQRKVDLGIREGDKVQLLNGVSPGDSVVIVGGLGVDDKTKVKVLTQPEESDDDQ
ncbi:MAG TPA: efflux RND transporter periplasmic adaptor subunit [Bryobacteraceae bacterium]|nr:efflux RND transporter periplasmic adaptor subunit [Bryobacteraceae bacterium]